MTDQTLAQRMYAAAQWHADKASDDLDKLDPGDPAYATASARTEAYGHTALMLKQMLSVAQSPPWPDPAARQTY